MDEMIIVRLAKLDVCEFCERCESLDCDIDLIDGSNTLDAKDYDHVIMLDLSKNLCVNIHSNDLREIARFNKVMSKYKVGK